MLHQALAELRDDASFMRSVAHWETIPARSAEFVDFPRAVDGRLRASFAARGITRLYSHQARCYQLAREGHHVVLVTPTASGKTLAYNLPILQRFLEEPDATALYLFPTKALSQDQQHELNGVVLEGDLPLAVATYDGDTPQAVRAKVRQEGRVIITNPDMLHTGVLPNHPKWVRFFRSLRFVVIDELHTYRGIFGSHLTNVLRRLKRVAAFYGASPQFICCSATIGNPKELASRLLEEDAELVDENGAPSGERHYLLYNPPLVDRVQGIRRGVVLEAQKLATRLLRRNIKTIVFARSRVRTELIANYIRQSLHADYDDRIGPTDGRRIEVAAYRGGYLPNERRAIEAGLRDGDIQGVVSTTALELGIDIGGLDASILAGFPGTIASSWQQAGRAGRSADVSLSVLIASASPIDQFIIRHPEYLFERSPESGWVDPDNVFVLMDQLKCAVFELPFADDEIEGGSLAGLREAYIEMLGYLEGGGVIRHAGGKWHWSDRAFPAENVSLRTSTAENVIIVDTTKGARRVIGEMDVPSAKILLYDGAIYLHRGAQYVVERLDLPNNRCYVEDADTGYFTDAIVKTDIKALHRDLEERHAGMEVQLADILVRRQATKFKKLRFRNHENVGYGDIHLPADEMHTRSIILAFAAGTAGGELLSALSEAEQTMIVTRLGSVLRNVAPVFLLCDPNDLGVAFRLRDPDLACPTIYLYDNYPGGSGLSEGLHQNLGVVLRGSLDLVRACECLGGCPSCVGPPTPQDAEERGPREAVLAALEAVVEAAAGGAAPAPAAAPLAHDTAEVAG